ncbi:cytidine deaminase [Erysipelotrichaceae bacterium]|nr:cytidine deaminase [Erysipelotrichaceae bacterium]
MKKDYLDWNTYFMGVAYLSGMRSKDPATQVGACIVNEFNRIVGMGYNGFPYGCDDMSFPWSKEGEFTETKYAYVVHAELNAILNSIGNIRGCTIYVTHFPCNECAKALIQSGIKKIIYASDKHKSTPTAYASRKMIEAAGITVIKVEEIEVGIKAAGMVYTSKK